MQIKCLPGRARVSAFPAPRKDTRFQKKKKEGKKKLTLSQSVWRCEHANMQMNTEAFEVALWRALTPRLGLSAALPINKTLLHAARVIGLASQERQPG